MSAARFTGWIKSLIHSRHRTVRRRRISVPMLEQLEERLVLTQVPAVWIGGVGNWNEPTNWDIGVVPNNDSQLGTTYAVTILGGAASNFSVILNTSVTLDALTLGADDFLRIDDGLKLVIKNTGPGTGVIHNSGMIALNSQGANTDLQIDGDVTLDGHGTIIMDETTDRILGSPGETSRLTNVDNSILSGGQIGVNSMWFTNHGNIQASSLTPLVIDVAEGPNAFVSTWNLNVQPSGTLTMGAGDDILINAGNLAVFGTLNSTGEIIIADGAEVLGDGSLTGDLTSSGTAWPISLGEKLQITGSYTQTAIAQLQIVLDGPTAHYLSVDGPVNLQGDLWTSVNDLFNPAVDDVIMVIDKTSAGAINGTFAGHADGSTFALGGFEFKITYFGGDGNDVELRVMSIPTVDYGDAPDTYGTYASSDGARHLAVGPKLGVARDAEVDGNATDTASGDDDYGLVDDEDGVDLPATITQLQGKVFTITASDDALIYAWMDLNRDGDFDDLNEEFLVGAAISAGENQFTLFAPGNSSVGQTYVRFRISTDTNLGPTGAASNGEVEDYAIIINEAPLNLHLEPNDQVIYTKKQPPLKIFSKMTVFGDVGGATVRLLLGQVTKGKKAFDSYVVPDVTAIGTTAGPQVTSTRIELEINLHAGTTAAQLQAFLRDITFKTKGKGLQSPDRLAGVILLKLPTINTGATLTFQVRKKAN